MLGRTASLMSLLRYPQRFALVGSVSLLMVVYLTYALFQTNQSNVDFSVQERLGIDYITGLPALLLAVQDHREAALRATPGAETVPAELGEGAQRANAAIKTLDGVDAKIGTDLSTTAKWRAVKSAWQAVQNAAVGGSAADIFERHQALIDQVLDLMVTACDGSNLTLDPDIDTYYLMNVSCVTIPNVMSQAGVSRDLAEGALQTKQLSDFARTRLVEVRPLLTSSVKSVQGDLGKAATANAELTRILSGKSTELAERADALRQVVDAALVPSFPSDAASARARGKAALDAALALREATVKQLDRLLEARISRLSNTRNVYVGAAIVAAFLTVFLFAALYRSITNQLGGDPLYVESIVKQLAEGRLDTDVKLAQQDQASLLFSVRMLRDQLRDSVAHFQNVTAEIDHASRAMASSSSSIAAASSTQADATAAMAAAVEELSTSISIGAENAESASTLSTAVSERSDEGRAIIENAVTEMSNIARDVEDSAQKVQELGRQSEEISKVVQVIKDVAEQTNLLALNAAIEAARAGEAGRGFAVVSDEVRKLAERSAGSTTEISQIVRNIQDAVREAVNRMENTVKGVQKGLVQAGEAGKAIARIGEGTHEAVVTIRHIARALKEQNATSQAVSVNVERVAQMTDENTASVRASVEATAGLKQLSERLSGLTKRFTV